MNKLSLITILFFLLGFVHISFSLLGFFCMIVPLIIKYYKKENLWCKTICPRKNFLSTLLGKVSLRLKKPRWLNYKSLKQFMVYYLTANVFFALMSSFMIYSGKAPSMFPFAHVRFIMAIELFPLPQLIDLSLPDYIIHLSYRVYSMMFSSTVLGLALGFLFGPTIWCAVCPMNHYINKV